MYFGNGPPLAHAEQLPTLMQLGSGTCAPLRPSPLRTAVAFYGLARDIDNTLPSVRENLLEPLRARGDVDVFVHAMLAPILRYKRTKELGNPLTMHSFLALFPCRFSAEDQDLVDAEGDLKSLSSRLLLPTTLKYMAFHDATTRLNMVRALYSMSKSARLVLAYESAVRMMYSHVVCARIDVYFMSRIGVHGLPMPPGAVRVLNTQHMQGINDRFAHGERRAMLNCVMEQLQTLRVGGAYQSTRVNAETFMCMHFAQCRLRIGVEPLCVVRSRAGGVLVASDYTAGVSLPYRNYQNCLRHVRRGLHASLLPNQTQSVPPLDPSRLMPWAAAALQRLASDPRFISKSDKELDAMDLELIESRKDEESKHPCRPQLDDKSSLLSCMLHNTTHSGS